MQGGWSWEQKPLISELIQGMACAKQLRAHLNEPPSSETRDYLLQRILSSYEKSLLILKWNGSMGQLHNFGATCAMPGSPLSNNGSPQSEDFDKESQEIRDGSKKRKTQPRWTDHVRVSSEGVLEGSHDDGYSWRKYGQKDILGAKYPRSYYRCTYRNTQNCWATKQVQRSDDDPTIFEVTYRGNHTCSQGNHAVPIPASPEKHEQKPKHHNTNSNQQQTSREILLNFRENLRVCTEGLESKEMVSPSTFPSTSHGCRKSSNYCFSPSGFDDSSALGSFSSSFMLADMPEMDYFSTSNCQTSSFAGILSAQHSESDLTGLISNTTSTTNSPIMDFNFSLDPVDLDPNFPFDTPGFFS